MKTILIELITQSLQQIPALAATKTGQWPIKIQHTKHPSHGDFASNIALLLNQQTSLSPMDLAAEIVAHLPSHDIIKKINVAAPGFINFFVHTTSYHQVIIDILQQKQRFGCSTLGDKQSILIEFVSANPTGPLHIGHGRGAAYGMAISNLLTCIGHQVDREYYVNDAGRQMDILSISIWLRYLAIFDPAIKLPPQAYQGQYVEHIATALMAQYQEKFCAQELVKLVSLLQQQIDPDTKLDAIIAFAKKTLAKDYKIIFEFGLQQIIATIKADLESFGVTYNYWFSERTLYESKSLDNYFQPLKEQGLCYEKDGALWFRSSLLGDDKDRVLIRQNGQATYFAADIVYHIKKFTRGYARIINIWGADHHGYVARIKAALTAFGKSTEQLDILLVQFATLYRGAEKLQMSTRSGEFITLKTLYDEIGQDAARFFYVMRRCEQHLDFDLELAKAKSNENPVYYIQYAHARICSVFRQLTEKNYRYDQSAGLICLQKLTLPQETALQILLARYPETIAHAATTYAPHELAYYLKALAEEFHSYYNAQQFIVSDALLRNARMALVQAVAQVLKNGLDILGVSAPEEM